MLPVCVKDKLQMKSTNEDSAIIEVDALGACRIWKGNNFQCVQCGYEVSVPEKMMVERSNDLFLEELDRTVKYFSGMSEKGAVLIYAYPNLATKSKFES
jgi:hypothetical protein